MKSVKDKSVAETNLFRGYAIQALGRVMVSHRVDAWEAQSGQYDEEFKAALYEVGLDKELDINRIMADVEFYTTVF